LNGRRTAHELAPGPSIVIDNLPREAAAWPVHAYTAGGGVVVRDGAVMLLWRNNGAVRLPKGHVEPDETLAACALREVREETGLRTLEIVTRKRGS
jgi:8-oxo-dGTP pyrophosphatase MutT (NUDIX family)